jgi:hypothetical protein
MAGDGRVEPGDDVVPLAGRPFRQRCELIRLQQECRFDQIGDTGVGGGELTGRSRVELPPVGRGTILLERGGIERRGREAGRFLRARRQRRG